MDNQVRIRRSRGAVCGAILVLLGLWGGLAPFVGPYIHFGFSPNSAWHYTTGRLYLSAVPGAAALLGGLLVAITRSRAFGVVGGLLAALGGAWFIVGSGVTLYLLKQATISAGTPLDFIGTGPYTIRAYAEVLALFGGLGTLIVFFGALACGRVSMFSARDAADADVFPDYPGSGLTSGADSTYPGSTQFPAGLYPSTQFPENPTGQFPTASGHFPTVSDQFTQPSALPSTSVAPEAENPTAPTT